MIARRREFLAGGVSLACAAMIGDRSARSLQSIEMQKQSLFFCSQGLASNAVAQCRLTASGQASPSRWTQYAVSVLSPDGFAATRALLENSKDGSVLALLNDADALVVERMLILRGAREMTMRREGRSAFVLTAIL